MSQAISSSTVQAAAKNQVVSYCRPFVNGTVNNFVFYVNPNSTAYLELGTLEFPFKNLDSSTKEVFNFMYSMDTVYTTYVMRGTSMFIYYGLMPIILLNIKQANFMPYGSAGSKPYVYVTDVPY